MNDITTSSWIWDVSAFGNKLIAYGSFETAGGVAAKNIAAWDGSAWSPLGPGISGWWQPLAVYDGKLIAGTIGEGDDVAVWDGASWSTFGLSLQWVAMAFAVYDGKLIVGGDIGGSVGGIPFNHIAAWSE